MPTILVNVLTGLAKHVTNTYGNCKVTSRVLDEVALTYFGKIQIQRCLPLLQNLRNKQKIILLDVRDPHENHSSLSS